MTNSEIANGMVGLSPMQKLYLNYCLTKGFVTNNGSTLSATEKQEVENLRDEYLLKSTSDKIDIVNKANENATGGDDFPDFPC